MKKTFNYEPPAKLLEKVLARLDREERRLLLRRKIYFFSAAAIIFSLLIIPAWQVFSAEAFESGFSQYITMAMSDLGIFSVYWKELSLSLLESLPALSLAAVLASFILAVASVKRLVEYRKTLRFILQYN